MGTTAALVVISSSAEVDPSFEEHLKTTVIGKWEFYSIKFEFSGILEAKSAWPDLIELSESMHQLFCHSYEVIYCLEYLSSFVKIISSFHFSMALFRWSRTTTCTDSRGCLRRTQSV